MDALLKYLLEKIAISLLGIELAIMLSCAIAIVIIKCITKIVAKHRLYVQDKISTMIEQFLLQDKNVEELVIPRTMRQCRNLIEVLEKFDQRFIDERWLEIKEKINSTYLLPLAPAYASSFSWVKRQFAARSSLLSPRLANPAVIGQLLEDKRYLVRVAAAVCVTQMSSQELFFRVIHMMSEETPLAQFPYRDALIEVSEEKYGWITSLLSTTTDDKIRAICLDILPLRYSPHLFALIQPFVTSGHRPCRLLAIKGIATINSEEAIEMLIRHLEDSEWEVRAESAIGLRQLHVIRAIPNLKERLNDPVWWVRLQAALALKNLGEPGVNVLLSKELDLYPHAAQIARYALALP
ncbi:MAG: HEAT repeat domain-containing protein [Parachlamydiaceae bacterium]